MRPYCECGNCDATAADAEILLPEEAWAVAGMGDTSRLAVAPGHETPYDDGRHTIERFDGWCAVGERAAFRVDIGPYRLDADAYANMLGAPRASALDTFTALPSIEFDERVAELREDEEDTYDGGWFCIKTAAWPCPASGCGFVAHHVTAAHLIVVWPSLDDSRLLAHARNAREADRRPTIVEYRPDMGRCISFDEWRRLGMPVHGYAAEPTGWRERTGRRL